MATPQQVRPNRRGARSRELVLDAAEQVMAEQGYEAASLARIVEVSGIPMSSVYHYFGSKDGVLVAVMERGAERFFASLPVLEEPLADPVEHLEAMLQLVSSALEEHPDFLRLLIVMTAQPLHGEQRGVHEVIDRVRNTARARLRYEMQRAFGVDPDGRTADRLARFALASIDGAFIARQGDEGVKIEDILEFTPAALAVLHDRMNA